jgi:hypothetical protein
MVATLRYLRAALLQCPSGAARARTPSGCVPAAAGASATASEAVAVVIE